MRKHIIASAIFILFVSSSYAIFDSKKIEELEQENATLKAEIAKLKSEIKKLKSQIGASSSTANTEIAAIATVLADIAKSEANYTEIGIDKIDIIQADFDTEDLNKCSYCTIYSNISIKNKNKFDVRVKLVVEIRGTGDKQKFIYEEKTIYAYLYAGELKTIVESFHIDDNSIKAGNGVTFNVRIENAVKYEAY